VEAIGVVVATQTLGRLYHRVGPRAMCTVGLVLLTAVIGSMTTIDAQTSIWVIQAMMFMAGAANSMVFLSVHTRIFESPPQTPVTGRDLQQPCGRHRSRSRVAILSTVVASVGGRSFAAFHAAYLAGPDRTHWQCHGVLLDPRQRCPRHDGWAGDSPDGDPASAWASAGPAEPGRRPGR
jgi:hypothetical protein